MLLSYLFRAPPTSPRTPQEGNSFPRDTRKSIPVRIPLPSSFPTSISGASPGPLAGGGELLSLIGILRLNRGSSAHFRHQDHPTHSTPLPHHQPRPAPVSVHAAASTLRRARARASQVKSEFVSAPVPRLISWHSVSDRTATVAVLKRARLARPFIFFFCPFQHQKLTSPLLIDQRIDIQLLKPQPWRTSNLKTPLWRTATLRTTTTMRTTAPARKTATMRCAQEAFSAIGFADKRR
ncbi:hypothetical protein LX36DRAFT_476764 [Colletotrichum falcatum]|nr:hypothetical protein LX36DRAFT_476764 [Colletotrichum falcatum]